MGVPFSNARPLALIRTPFYFCSFFERDLAEVRGVSVEGTSQAESSGDRPGLREVVAVKALSGARDSERGRDGEKSKSAAEALF